MPALGIEMLGDGGRAVSLGVPGGHAGHHLGVVTQLIEAGNGSDQRSLGTVATEPVNLDVDLLALTANRDNHPLD